MIYRPLPVLAFIAVCALFIKIYQHHRLVEITHQHQRLSLEHAELMEKCMRLRKQYAQEASLDSVYSYARSEKNFQPLSPDQVVPLKTIKGR